MVGGGQTRRQNAISAPEVRDRMLSEVRSLMLLIVGFGSLVGFFFLIVPAFSSQAPSSVQLAADARLLSYAAGEAVALLVLAVMGWRGRPSVGPVIMVLAALCVSAVVLASPFDFPQPVGFALAAIGGASSAMLAYVWMLVLSRFDMRVASVAVLLGFTLACLIGESAPLLGSDLMVDVTAATAIVSAIVAVLLDPKLECCKSDGALSASDAAKVPWLTIMLLVACGLLASVMCGVAGNSAQVLSWQPDALVFEGAFAVTLLVTVVVMFRVRSWMHVVWAPFLALFVIATALSLMSFAGAVELASGLMMAAMICGGLLVWLVLPSLLSALNVPRAFLAGAMLACTATPLAYAIGSVLGTMLPVGVLNLAGVSGSFAVVVSVLFAVTFIVNRNLFGAAGTWGGEGASPVGKGSASEVQAADGVQTAEGVQAADGVQTVEGVQAAEARRPDSIDPADVLKARLGELAEERGLTPRETEVALFTVQGFSCAYIAEQLVVSSSTVRFHQQNIYRKFEVHSRNELIEAVTQKHQSEQA